VVDGERDVILMSFEGRYGILGGILQRKTKCVPIRFFVVKSQTLTVRSSLVDSRYGLTTPVSFYVAQDATGG